MRYRLHVFLAWCVLASLAVAQSPGPGPFIPPIQVFGEKQGLPHLTIHDLKVDPEGRLWAATQGGVAVFNGRAWTPLPLPAESQSTYIRALLPAQDGTLWVGTQDDGLWEYRGGIWKHHSKANGFPASRVNCLLELRTSGETVLLAGTGGNGLLRLKGTGWEPVEELPSTWIWRLREDPRKAGTVWIGMPEGLASWDLSARGHPVLVAKSPASGFEVNDFTWLPGVGGALEFWVAVWGKGVARLDGETLVFPAQAPPFPSPNITCLTAGPGPQGQEVLWAGTYAYGLFWRDAAGAWQPASYLHGLSGRGVYCLLARPGARPALWVGHQGGGIASVDFQGWWTLALPFQDAAPGAYAIALVQEDGQEHLWVASSHGLAQWNGRTWRIHTTQDGLPDMRCEALYATDQFGPGGLVASTLRGLAVWQGKRWRPLLFPGPAWRSAKAFLESREGGKPAFWVGGYNGLAKYSEGHWTPFIEPGAGLVHQPIYSLAETLDPDGGKSVWVGTRGEGLGRLKGGRLTWVPQESGPSHPSIYSLMVTPGPGGFQRLWTGTLGGGLAWVDVDRPGATWRHLSTATQPPLVSNAILALVRDGQNRIYLATQNGVQRWEIPPGTEDDPSKWRSTHYATGDGLPSQITFDGAAYLDPRGRVWIGTVKGMAVLDPLHEPPPEPLGTILLDRVLAGERVVLAQGRLELLHPERNLSVSFSLPNQHRAEDQVFQTQLWPVESQPTPWLGRDHRDMAGLAPGTYTLRIQGKDHLGRLTAIRDVPFWVQAPPWRRPWALALMGLTLCGLVLLLERARLQILRRRNAYLESRIQEAVATVAAQKDNLERLNEEKTRMMGLLAHDLRNPLGAVRLYAEGLVEGMEDAADVRRVGLRIGGAVDRVLEMATRVLDITAIDTGHVHLSLEPVELAPLFELVEEEQGHKARAKGQAIVFEILPEAGRLQADPRVLKEVLDNLVSNALKFMPPGPPLRQVRLRAGPGWIEVVDEGPGFRPADLAKVFGRFERLSARPTGGESSTGLGLSIVKSLVESMGGQVRLSSVFGEGSTFRLEFPTA